MNFYDLFFSAGSLSSDALVLIQTIFDLCQHLCGSLESADVILSKPSLPETSVTASFTLLLTYTVLVKKHEAKHKTVQQLRELMLSIRLDLKTKSD